MKYLHIVSFDVPDPPNYGGVIDVYYKIKALHESGVKIILHCFQYGRMGSEPLKKYCEKIYYYKRKSILSFFSIRPYIVQSRRSRELLKNLKQDNYPILFEGLHTCAYLSHPALASRLKSVRLHNVEHDYYFHLAQAEKSPIKKIYFFLEALKLKMYEGQLSYAGLLLPISLADEVYYKRRFQDARVFTVDAFIPFQKVNIMSGKGSYILYHGNLAVNENERAALYLAEDLLGGGEISFVIAGNNPSKNLVKKLQKFPNVQLVKNPSEEALTSLIQNAQINLLVTFQPTGIKLKLFNALFHGRHCLVNTQMLEGNALGLVCHIADGRDNLRKKINELFLTPFTVEMISQRKDFFEKHFSNNKTVVNIITEIYRN